MSETPAPDSSTEEKYHKPTSEPPEGVEIPPVDYGPLPVFDPPPETTPAIASPTTEENKPKTIKIGLGTLLGLQVFLLTVLGIGGFKLLGNIKKPGKPTIAEQKAAAAKKEEETKYIPKTGFIPDRGYYRRANTYTAPEVVATRVNSTKKSIIWITSEPNNENILASITKRKAETGMPVYILCGKETGQHKIRRAQETGLTVHQVKEELETPYSIFLLDNKLVIDGSREHFIWETVEKKVIQDISAWAEELIAGSEINR
jgi:hypothetical protein